jgi:uncharacterized small protein (DUF1192 family)
MKTIITNKPSYNQLMMMYEEEKKRADLLQDDLNSINLMHYDECASLRAEIALLKQELNRKQLN